MSMQEFKPQANTGQLSDADQVVPGFNRTEVGDKATEYAGALLPSLLAHRSRRKVVLGLAGLTALALGGGAWFWKNRSDATAQALAQQEQQAAYESERQQQFAGALQDGWTLWQRSSGQEYINAIPLEGSSGIERKTEQAYVMGQADGSGVITGPKTVMVTGETTAFGNGTLKGYMELDTIDLPARTLGRIRFEKAQKDGSSPVVRTEKITNLTDDELRTFLNGGASTITRAQQQPLTNQDIFFLRQVFQADGFLSDPNMTQAYLEYNNIAPGGPFPDQYKKVEGFDFYGDLKRFYTDVSKEK